MEIGKFYIIQPKKGGDPFVGKLLEIETIELDHDSYEGVGVFSTTNGNKKFNLNGDYTFKEAEETEEKRRMTEEEAEEKRRMAEEEEGIELTDFTKRGGKSRKSRKSKSRKSKSRKSRKSKSKKSKKFRR